MNLLDRINESPWKGMIAECGFGVPISAVYLDQAGASKTILYTCSPYSRSFQSFDKAVSREAVTSMIERLESMKPEDENGPMFYLTVSGSHKGYKERGDSHGWMGLKTVIPSESGPQEALTLIHFRVKKRIKSEEVSRAQAGQFVYYLATWLMKAILMGEYDSWSHAIEKIPFPEYLQVNIIDDPRISVEEHLELAHFTNPLLFHNGRFERPLDYVRKYERYMGGSFNPPHQGHLDMGKDAIFLINYENARKETITPRDMSHRVSMLDSVGVPVMVTKERPLTAMQAHLLRGLGRKEITFITGVDTFNAICNTKYIPVEEDALKQMMGPLATEEQAVTIREDILTEFLEPIAADSGVNFEVYLREDLEVEDNKWTKMLDYEVKEVLSNDCSSTEVREGNYNLVPETISSYIKKHNLYQG